MFDFKNLLIFQLKKCTIARKETEMIRYCSILILKSQKDRLFFLSSYFENVET